MPPQRYRVTVVGRLPEGADQELSEMTITVDDEKTTITGEVTDAAALYGLVARLESLGVALRSIEPARRAPGQPPAP